MTAIVYEMDFEKAEHHAVGRIRLIGGKLVGDPPTQDSVEWILDNPVRGADGRLFLWEADPAAFLAALPAMYTGTGMRVGLEED